MTVYFDTAYIAKCYVNEADSTEVRALLRKVGHGTSSALCIPEIAAVLLRHLREGALERKHATQLRDQFMEDVREGVWTTIPLGGAFLDRVAGRIATLDRRTPVRAGDAIHLWAANEAGLGEVWTNDRHMLAAAPQFGVKGRSV